MEAGQTRVSGLGYVKYYENTNTGSPHGATEAHQRDWLMRTYLIANAHGIDRSTMYMSRDTAEKIYQVASAEIVYAMANGKLLNLGVETHSTEGNQVSFQEEGSAVMLSELKKLRTMIPGNFGTVVHQIKTWYTLK